MTTIDFPSAYIQTSSQFGSLLSFRPHFPLLPFHSHSVTKLSGNFGKTTSRGREEGWTAEVEGGSAGVRGGPPPCNTHVGRLCPQCPGETNCPWKSISFKQKKQQEDLEPGSGRGVLPISGPPGCSSKEARIRSLEPLG